MMDNTQLGIKSFFKKDYQSAMMYFSLALQNEPESEELRIYLSLTSLANKKEEEAISLFEFYRVTLKDTTMQKPKNFEEVIDSLETGLERMHELFETKEIERFLLEENGIIYEDFLLLVHEKGSFAKAFEDIMFSTKVLISKKEDFMHFLNLLVDNGFTDMALNYLENAVSLFPGESTLQDIANKVAQSR